MPAVMTFGGIALAVLGLLVAFAGLPDRAAGLGYGSDLIQAGASLFAGGLVVAALGQLLQALRDVADRVEEAGLGLSAPRQSLNDELADTASPIPLPRAATRTAAASARDELPESPAAKQQARESRAPRTPEPAPRSARPAPEQLRPQPRGAVRPAQPEQHDDDFAEDYAAERRSPRQSSRPDPRPEQHQEPHHEPRADSHPEPRWLRAQAEANNRQQQPAGTVPLQAERTSRAGPVVPPVPPRRESAAAPAPSAYEADPRRRSAPQPDELPHGEPTVVRSGIIGGMAYTLYSDRSIEAELPAGTVRFNSIAELQEHVKRAGVEEQDADYRGQNNSAQH